ncbi:MAG: UDP-N-acetylmuramoyl-tripeptide--D-alanyl-D-alanine ligase [Firmicutes bacterium]|nr:UDP-N-acetylmuramoyl-tripeptide--D-alanyl-D-alanine ligase [Bacillota bacterium]
MKQLTIKQVKEATGGTLLQGSEEAAICDISTDSRKAEGGDLFFALIGENHDAHVYLPQVIEAGCTAMVISDEAAFRKLQGRGERKGAELNAVLLVEDTTKALQDLASYYLRLLDIKKIAVTGSTGKTSTRDLIGRVCSQKYKTQKNMGNLNNHIGVPLTILSLEEDTQVAVLEMGMDKFREIDLLARIARPDIGVITNIGMSHIENLGSREGIFKAKMELTNYFDQTNTLIFHQEGEFLNKEQIHGSYHIVTTGIDGKSDYIISGIEDFGAEGIQFSLEHKGRLQKFRLPIPGRHNAYNSALAVAAGMQLGITMEEAAAGLAQAELTDKRLTVRGKNGIKVIDDTYNASPDSMKGAVDVLMHTRGLRSVAVLGDMFELGDTSSSQHELVGRYAAEQGVELIVAIGENAGFIRKGAEACGHSNVLWFSEKKEFLKRLDTIIQKGDVVLVKGSRGMEMEQIVKQIME